EPYLLNVVQKDATSKVVTQHCTVSIGLVVFNGAQATQDDVLKAADAAMYQAKDAGRNAIHFLMTGVG
ncbi:MAG TPA: diguanylate cyclase, partial [Rhodoferax sp.]